MMLNTRAEVAAETQAGPILTLAFAGDYPPGSEANPTASAMKAFVKENVELHQPAGVIFDLGELKYVWGDAIGGIMHAILMRDRTPVKAIPSCLVASGETAEAIKPLFGPNWIFGAFGCQLVPSVKIALERLSDGHS